MSRRSEHCLSDQTYDISLILLTDMIGILFRYGLIWKIKLNLLICYINIFFGWITTRK